MRGREGERAGSRAAGWRGRGQARRLWRAASSAWPRRTPAPTRYSHTHAPRTHTSQCSRLEYTLLDISDDGYLSLMTEGGDTKDDLTLPSGTGARAFVACGSGARPAPRAPPRSPLPPYARIRCAVMQMRPTSWLS